MKHLNTYITEYIVKKKLDKPINSENNYKYFPETKEELITNIKKLLSKGEINLNYIDTHNITDMSHLFETLNISTNIDVSNWDVSNVTNMDSMFAGRTKFDCNLSKWDVSKVENMKNMFSWCSNFTGKGLENWNVSNVTNMRYMFGECNKFKGKSIENWDVSNVEDMSYMFEYCTRLNCNLNNWNVSNVKKKTGIFQGTKGIKNKTIWYK